jgi:hypothetical protein
MSCLDSKEAVPRLFSTRAAFARSESQGLSPRASPLASPWSKGSASLQANLPFPRYPPPSNQGAG